MAEVSESKVSESKRLWRTAFVVAGVGVLVLVPLAWLALRMWEDTVRRKVIAANESAAITNLDAIRAAQDLYFRANGQYGNFQQLIESGIFQAAVAGDPPTASGYVFTVRVQPKTDTQPPSYSVNADPVRSGGRDATGRRHFFASSDVVAVRYHDSRPATKDDKPRPTMQEY